MDLYVTTRLHGFRELRPPREELRRNSTTRAARRLEREFQEASEAHSAAGAALQTAIAEDRARLADAKLKGRKKLPAARDSDQDRIDPSRSTRGQRIAEA